MQTGIQDLSITLPEIMQPHTATYQLEEFYRESEIVLL